MKRSVDKPQNNSPQNTNIQRKAKNAVKKLKSY